MLKRVMLLCLACISVERIAFNGLHCKRINACIANISYGDVLSEFGDLIPLTQHSFR